MIIQEDNPTRAKTWNFLFCWNGYGAVSHSHRIAAVSYSLKLF